MSRAPRSSPLRAPQTAEVRTRCATRSKARIRRPSLVKVTHPFVRTSKLAQYVVGTRCVGGRGWTYVLTLRSPFPPLVSGFRCFFPFHLSFFFSSKKSVLFAVEGWRRLRRPVLRGRAMVHCAYRPGDRPWQVLCYLHRVR